MLAGLARDGGLYLPAEWPQFSQGRDRRAQGPALWLKVAYRVMRRSSAMPFDERPSVA
jgi:threonine synthase